MPYLMIGYAAAILLLIVGCRVCARTIPGLRGVRLLSWACLSGLAGVVLLALRPVAPAWATILAANEAIFLSSLLQYRAAADTLGVRPRFLPWGIRLLIAALLANSWFVYVHPSLVARILTGTGVPAAFNAATALLLFWPAMGAAERQSLPESSLPLVRALGWLQVLTFSQNVIRCILTVVYPPSEILHMDLVQAAYTYSNLILNVSAVCGLIWLALAMHRGELYFRAETDGLTGLLNRRAFEEILGREVPRASEARPLALILADIDRFKEVNDVWGHQAGDEVIRRVSQTLRGSMRPADSISRFGGEEFVILLRETSAMQAQAIAERLRGEIAALTDLPGVGTVTVSFGVAESRPLENAEELLRRCDEALYRSKHGGRNLVSVHDSGPQASTPASYAEAGERTAGSGKAKRLRAV